MDGKVPQIRAANDPHHSLGCNSKVAGIGMGDTLGDPGAGWG